MGFFEIIIFFVAKCALQHSFHRTRDTACHRVIAKEALWVRRVIFRHTLFAFVNVRRSFYTVTLLAVIIHVLAWQTFLLSEIVESCGTLAQTFSIDKLESSFAFCALRLTSALRTCEMNIWTWKTTCFFGVITILTKSAREIVFVSALQTEIIDDRTKNTYIRCPGWKASICAWTEVIFEWVLSNAFFASERQIVVALQASKGS